MCEKTTTSTRVRIAYKISAKGQFQPDVTSEAEDVDVAIKNLREALWKVKELAKSENTLVEELTPRQMKEVLGQE